MESISPGDVVVSDDRIRREFDEEALEALKNSIKRFGLIHAPVVKDDGVTLIAGERRLRAITELFEKGEEFFYGEELFKETVPVVRMRELSVFEKISIEFEENVRRKDLTWQEEAEARKRFHSMRLKETDGKQTLEQTVTAILGTSNSGETTKLRNDLILAEFLDDEEVAAAPNRNEAIKILQKKTEAKRRKKLAETYDLKKVEGAEHEVIHASMFDIFPTLLPGRFTAIIADPPYGIDADKMNNQSAPKHVYKDDVEYSDAVINLIGQEGLRITTSQAHLYLFLDIRRFGYIRNMLTGLGWDVWETPWIWYKGPEVGVAPRPEHGPRRNYEAILFAIKGGKTSPFVGSDVYHVSHDRTIVRAAHKPPELYQKLLERSVVPGDEVLDPCCGAGPIFLAAKKLKVRATGIETDKEAVGICYERINEKDN